MHPFAADIAAARLGPGADLVDLVQKHDAVLFDRFQSQAIDSFIIQQLVGLFPDQGVIALGDGQAGA